MKTIEVVAAVIFKDGKVFATQRGHGEFKDGWEFPGGKIEPGETPEDALRREIREELETDVLIRELIDTIEYDYSDFHLSMKCFACSIQSGNLHLVEHEVAKCSLPTGLIPLTGSRRTSPLSPESPDCSRPPRYDVRDSDDCRRWPIGRRKSKVNMKVTSKRRMETRSEATEGGRGVLSSCPSGAVTK